ncbi:MAG: hypothetical protein ACREPS_11485 [Rhodanobacteraceae bacterium]
MARRTSAWSSNACSEKPQHSRVVLASLPSIHASWPGLRLWF